MAKKQTFEAPAAPGRDYTPIQSTAAPAPDQQPADEKLPPYRFNAKMPGIYGKYLQEMAWRATVMEHKSVTVTEYINRLIKADMDAHPEWTESLDILNK